MAGSDGSFQILLPMEPQLECPIKLIVSEAGARARVRFPDYELNRAFQLGLLRK